MPLGTDELYHNRLEWFEHVHEMVFVYPGRAEIKVLGVPVSVIKGMDNAWAWISPISPWTQYIRRHGGYDKATSHTRK